jgi:hypothetical protein
MNQPISRVQHGIADYGYIPAVALAPNLVGFEDEKKASNLSRIISGGVLLTTLATRAEWGLFKVLPYKAHLAADVAVSALSASAPWLFGFADNKKARNTFLVMGAFGMLVTLLSRPEEMPEYKLHK